MAEEQQPSGGGASFSKKVGGVPVWGWIAGAAGLGLFIIWWRNRQAANAAAATSNQASADQGFDYGPSYAAIQSEIQNLQTGQAQQAAGETEQEQDISALEKDEKSEIGGKPIRKGVRKPPPKHKPRPHQPPPRRRPQQRVPHHPVREPGGPGHRRAG